MSKRTQDEEIRDLLEKRAELIHDAYPVGGNGRGDNAEAPREVFDEPKKAEKKRKSGLTRHVLLICLIMGTTFLCFAYSSSAGKKPCVPGRFMDFKPVIYLYPERKSDVTVKLDYNGKLTYTYPQYRDGWSVTASPDGTLINHADDREYSYLFWEGESQSNYDFSKGFVVKGSDTVAFLQEKLAYLGLTPREYNEFIVYWLPQMQDNPYNLIAFQGAAYTDNAKLTITPKPDSVLRVFMAFKPLGYPMDIQPQELKTLERKGFAVVEWGGTQAP